MEYELTKERKDFLEKDYCRGFINFLKPAYGNELRCRSEIVNEGKQIIVAQSSVFDLRDTHEKMVSRSTITLMAVNAEKLDDKRR